MPIQAIRMHYVDVAALSQIPQTHTHFTLRTVHIFFRIDA